METNKKIAIPLEGVHSEHCALIIDNTLDKTEGIKHHKVELNNNQAKIEVDSKFNLKQLTENIRNLGYDITTKKKTIPLLG